MLIASEFLVCKNFGSVRKTPGKSKKLCSTPQGKFGCKTLIHLLFLLLPTSSFSGGGGNRGSRSTPNLFEYNNIFQKNTGRGFLRAPQQGLMYILYRLLPPLISHCLCRVEELSCGGMVSAVREAFCETMTCVVQLSSRYPMVCFNSVVLLCTIPFTR